MKWILLISCLILIIIFFTIKIYSNRKTSFYKDEEDEDSDFLCDGEDQEYEEDDSYDDESRENQEDYFHDDQM